MSAIGGYVRIRVFKIRPQRWCMRVYRNGRVCGAALHPTWHHAMRHAALIARAQPVGDTHVTGVFGRTA